MRTFYLFYDKDKIVDIKQHMKTDNHETAILGVLINVDGSYVKRSDVEKLVHKSKENHKEYDEYHWCRDNDGRVISKRSSK